MQTMTSSCNLKNTSFCIYQKRHFWRGFWKPHLYRAFLNLVRVDFLALKFWFWWKWNFFPKISKNEVKISKKFEIFDKNGHARWAFMQVDFRTNFWWFLENSEFLKNFVFLKNFEFWKKILKISKKISRCKIEIIFCKITKTRIRVETLCGNYRIG